MKILIILLSLSFVLTGCDQEISTTVYVRDLQDTLKGETDISAKSTVELEMSSEKNCLKKKDKITRVISPFFIGINKVQCRKDIYFANFDIPMSMLIDDEISEAFVGGLSIQLHENNEKTISPYITANQKLLSKLNKDLSSEFSISQGINPNKLKFTLKINNDSRNKIKITAKGVFLDGLAIPASSPGQVILERRDESTIVLSNVSVMTILGKGNRNWINFLNVANSE